MFKTLNALLRSSFFFTFANSIEAFSPVVLAMVLTRFLSPDDFGLWILFIAFVTFLRPIVGLSINDALRMHFYEFDDESKSSFVLASLSLSTCLSLFVVFLSFIFASWIGNITGFSAHWVPFIPVAAYLYAVFYFLLAYHQFSQQRLRFLLLHLVQTFFGLLVITLLLFYGFDWRGSILGKCAGLVACIFLGLYWLYSSGALTSGKVNRATLSRLASFGLLYMPTGMGLVAIPLTDRVIVSNVLGFKETGLFGAAALFGSVLFVVVNGFIFAWMPWLFRSLSRSNVNKKEIFRISLLFLLTLPLIGFVVSIVSRHIAPVIIGDQFFSAFSLIPWSIAGVVFMGYFYHNQAFLHFYKAIPAMSICSVCCIFLNALISYYGAVHLGLIGVFVGTIVAFGFCAVLSSVLFALHLRLGIPSGEASSVE